MTTSPCHQLCASRKDACFGELALIATGLNAVRTADTTKFFDRTYPTFRMKELGREVRRGMKRR